MSSSSEIRDAIVTALGKVDGISAYRTVPQVVAPGAAWPVRYQVTGWRNACVVGMQWFVLVALPSIDRAETVDAGDTLLDDVAETLWHVGQISNVTDWSWPVAAGSVPALRFTLNITT
jgi:hypothetical protein